MAKVALPRQNCFLRLRIRVEEKPPCIKFKYRVDKIKLVFDHRGELYKSEKYQHVEESRMLAICKTLISFTMALNLSSIYSDQRVKRVLLHLVPSPPQPCSPASQAAPFSLRLTVNRPCWDLFPHPWHSHATAPYQTLHFFTSHCLKNN